MNSGERASERASRREGKGEERLKEKSGTGGKVQFLQWEGGGEVCWNYLGGILLWKHHENRYKCRYVPLIAEGEVTHGHNPRPFPPAN